MLIGEIEHEGPLSWSDASMNAHERMQSPPGGWMLPPCPLWSGTRRVMPLTRLTHAVLPGRLHPQTHGHDPQEGHDPVGCFAGARGGQTRGIVHEATPARSMRLACVGVQQRVRWQVGGVEVGGGQEATTVLVDAGWSGRPRGGHGPRALLDHVIGLHALSGASPCAIAGRGAHGAGSQTRGLQVLREGGKRRTRLGFARTGDAA